MAVVLSKGKALSVFSLVMINIIAVDSLRTLPVSAEYGFSLVFYYLIAAFVFFIPVALVAAELATGWPHTGGIYVWVREAFGPRWGFITIWMQWIYNVVWYPTILAFITSALAYLIDPALAQNKFYVIATILVLFWAATAANLMGLSVSSIVSIIGATVGTLLPMLTVIGLAGYWFSKGLPLAITMDWDSFIPKHHDLSSLVLLTGVLFGLVGMEMSAVHAGDVASPQRDYPRALFFSTLIILGSLVLGSLAVAIVVPESQLSLITGVLDAFTIFFNHLRAPWLMPWVVTMMIIGALGSVSTWVLGPSKGLLVAAQDGCLPAIFFKVNKHGAPITILLLQATIFSALAFVFTCFDDLNVSYWMLSALTEQLAMLVYVLLFLAAIRLRFIRPDTKRAFKIPGGNVVMVLVAGMGLLTCVGAVLLGFIPPSQLNVTHVGFYQLFLISGLTGFIFLPWLYAGKHLRRSTPY